MKKQYLLFYLLILFYHFVFSNDSNISLNQAEIDTSVIVKGHKGFYQAGRFYFGGQPDDTTF